MNRRGLLFVALALAAFCARPAFADFGNLQGETRTTVATQTIGETLGGGWTDTIREIRLRVEHGPTGTVGFRFYLMSENWDTVYAAVDCPVGMFSDPNYYDPATRNLRLDDALGCTPYDPPGSLPPYPDVFGYKFSSPALYGWKILWQGPGGYFWGTENANAWPGVMMEPKAPIKDVYFYFIGEAYADHELPVMQYPMDGDTITETPIAFAGTCDETDGFDWVNIEIRDAAGTLQMLRTTSCISGGFGAYDDPGDLWNGTFTATPVSFTTTGARVVGPSASFTVNDPANPNPGPPPPPEDCSAAGTITEQAVCYFAQKIGEMAQFWFTPSQGALSRFLGLTAVIGRKPPFGYFVVSKAAILEMAATTGEDFVGIDALEDFFDTFRVVFVAGIWVLFAFYLIHRIQAVEI